MSTLFVALAWLAIPGARCFNIIIPTPAPAPAGDDFAVILPRQTDILGGLSPECASVLLNLSPPPTAAPGLQSYFLSAAATATNQCDIQPPGSLSSDYSSYQSAATSWLSENDAKLSACPQIKSLQAQYSGLCSSTGANPPSTESRQTRTGSAGTTTSRAPNEQSNTSPSLSQDKSSSLSVGAIAGIVVGGIAGVATIAGVIVFFLWRAKRKPKAGSVPAMQQNLQYQGDSHGTPQQPGLPYDKTLYPYPPQGQYIYEMPQPAMQPPSELMGSIQPQPAEPGQNPAPLYEMPAAQAHDGRLR